MSADKWLLCPKCDAVNPDSEPGDEYEGTVRLDHEFYNECNTHDGEPGDRRIGLRLSFDCTECDFRSTITAADLPQLDPKRE